MKHIQELFIAVATIELVRSLVGASYLGAGRSQADAKQAANLSAVAAATVVVIDVAVRTYDLIGGALALAYIAVLVFGSRAVAAASAGHKKLHANGSNIVKRQSDPKPHHSRHRHVAVSARSTKQRHTIVG